MNGNQNNGRNTLTEYKHHACPLGHIATLLMDDLETVIPVIQRDGEGNRQYYCEGCSPPRIFSVDSDEHIVFHEK